nr:AEC family transporter [uncultured Flavobacterium sp.]
MDSIILIVICMLAGVLLRRQNIVPLNAHVTLNQFAIYLLLPALSLYYIPKIHITDKLLYPVGVGWFSFLFSWAFFAVLGKMLGWSRKLQGCLILTAGFLNSSFIGFPVVEALYGKKGLETAILVDQPGTFVMLSTLGVLVAVLYSSGTPSASDIAKRVFTFPPFIGFAIGAVMNLLHFDFPDVIQTVLQKLGACVTPVALVAVGLQLKIDRYSKHWGFLGLGLAVKLLIIPALFVLVYKIILGAEGEYIDISIIEAATPPMITAAILASSHGLKPRLAGMMIGIGIPLSFLTLAFWFFVLKHW